MVEDTIHGALHVLREERYQIEEAIGALEHASPVEFVRRGSPRGQASW